MSTETAEAARRAVVSSVNISERKGTQKTPVEGPEEVREQYGFVRDAHAGDWHRQVSFLASESIDRACEMGLDVGEGSFGENFTTEGLDLDALPLGTRLKIGDEIVVEVSQIGKVCHTRCAIYYAAGDCIFPREGIFGVVLHGGMAEEGDEIEVLELGDGTCEFSPPEALEEVEAARAAGTL